MAPEHRAVWGAERGEADADGAAGLFMANAVGLGDDDLAHARHMELHAELAGRSKRGSMRAPVSEISRAMQSMGMPSSTALRKKPAGRRCDARRSKLIGDLA